MVQQKECSISLVRLWAAPLVVSPGSLEARCQGEGSCIRGAPSSGRAGEGAGAGAGPGQRQIQEQKQEKGQGQRQEACRGKIAGVLLNHEHDHDLEQKQELKQE